MGRSLTTAFKNELVAGVIRPIFLFSGVFGGTTYYFSTAGSDISWNSQTWLGNGYITAISVSNENQEEGASGMSITLTGEPQSLISLILNNLKHSQVGNFYFGFLDTSRNVIADPHLIFSGKMDQGDILDSPDSSSITITYESALAKLQKASNLRYNQRTQQQVYATDMGFEFMEKLVDWTGYWGKIQKIEKKKKRKGSK